MIPSFESWKNKLPLIIRNTVSYTHLLGYSRYDYRNKETDNSRNGHSSKTLRTSFGDVEVSIPRDRKGEFEPRLLKKNQTSISQDIEEKILSMYAKGMRCV